MSQILINLKDPSWWFTGIFFVLIGLLLKGFVSNWLPTIWSHTSQWVPRQSNKILRWRKKKLLLRVKKYRQHQVKVNWLIARYWGIASMYLFMCSMLLFSYLFTNVKLEKQDSIVEFLPIVVPIYVLQFLLMWEQLVVKRTIEGHVKWQKRITSRLSSLRPYGAPQDSQRSALRAQDALPAS